jgi:UDP-N-acetylmuramoyl-tripeptide--D-alanyl-D-alanine ligase
MLQATEYQTGPYLRWFWRTQNFGSVMRRRQLDRTGPARLLLICLRLGIILQALIGLGLIGYGWRQDALEFIYFGLALLLSYPLIWGHLVTLPLFLGRWLIVKPRERKLIKASEHTFAEHPGKKIAVAGSYGKTSMKELLLTVLSEGLKVAATPANKNVAISHAYFAQKLHGDEDIVILEYGEGKPGDVARFAHTTHPTHAIITGIAPAHLDQYKTLDRAAKDIFAVADYLNGENVYVNNESPSAKPYLHKPYHLYDASGALGWSVHDIHVGLDGSQFILKKGDRVLKLQTGLLGRHQIGVLSLVAALAAEFGLSDKQIKAGIAKTKAFEHRMNPYPLAGAWIIDDTYNGNLEGIRAGTALLKELPAKRKIYVTPGLVDQGVETKAVHIEMGQLIAAARPDLVVLMQSSVTKFIEKGLKEAEFAGELRIETNPLEFYTNLDQILAAGDVVLMQNDWTDNYA